MIISLSISRIKKMFLLIAALAFIGGCSDENDDQPLKGSDFIALSDNGAWCWFSDPRAVYYNGEKRRTYAGWINSEGDVQIGFFDHDNGDIQTETLVDNFQADDHNHPSIQITPAGQLLVFYSKHATEEPIFLSRSKNPEDISEWEEPKELDLNDEDRYDGFSDTYTYSNPVYLAEEDKLYLFWRGSDFKPNYAFSEDLGESWSQGEIVILPDREYHNRRPYLKVATNGKDEIHFAFTQGHPRQEEANSIYYMSYEKETYNQANGTQIADSLPVAPSEADLVYNAKDGPKAWVWDVAADENSNPAIVYATFPDDSTHVYHYAKWNGGSWQNHKLLNSGGWFPDTPDGKSEPEPNYSAGIALDHENPNTVYLSREVGEVFEIEKWVTNDQGKTWDRRLVTSKSFKDNVRPVAVRNAEEGNPLQFLWMLNEKYIHYTDYHSTIKINSIQ